MKVLRALNELGFNSENHGESWKRGLSNFLPTHKLILV